MSLFEQKHDDALLEVPWLTKETNTGRWLFKYAPHPDRAGYVFLATNLTAMLFEALTAPSIPTRLAKMASSSSRSRVTESQRDDVDTADKAHAVLDTLEKKIMVLGSKWGRAEVEVKEDGFYDRVISVSTTADDEEFRWVFNMAELRSTIPLAFIARHLIGPMASHFAPQGTMPTSVDPLEAVGAMLDDPDLAKRVSGRSQGSSRDSGHATRSTQATATLDDSHSRGSQSQSRSPTKDDPAFTKEEALEDIAEEEEAEEEYHSSPAASPANTRSHRKSDSPSAEEQSLSPVKEDPNTKLAPSRPKASVRSADKVSASPVKPSTTQLSQKSKREREKEEEESLEHRREEMKKRMGAGGGGRLGRRRAAR